ncbi:MAG TPA: asparagine synthase-related protein [Stellaceae bacterium]|jgi:asparagine synthase (glutamine-hydrolysing)
MTAFAGIVRFDGSPIDAGTEDRMVRSVSIGRGPAIPPQRTASALFVSRNQQPLVRNGRSLSAALARLDNRDELGASLNLTPLALKDISDPALLTQIVTRQGETGIARCLGAFAFACWDEGRRELTLGRDCLGSNRALFFHRARDFCVFATNLPALLSLPFVPREIDEIELANFMAINFRATNRTVYLGVERVASRTLITLAPGTTDRRHYWSPAFDAPPPFRREDDYVEQARELFDRAVATATGDDRRIAVSTSGGLDSSAVAATAARLGRAEQITCYTLVPPEGAVSHPHPSRYQDETAKVVALRRMHPSLDLRLLMPETPHPFERDPIHYFAATGAPVFDPTNLGWFSHLHDTAAADAHRLLLDGTYGNLGLTWDGKFALRAALRQRDWRAVAREVPLMAAEDGVSPARILMSHILMPNAPAAVSRLVHRLHGRDPNGVARYSALSPAFIKERDLARQWREAGFDPWFRKSGTEAARHRAFQLFDNNQPARDYLASMSERYGFEARSPHADRRLLEFTLAVPEPLYRRDGVARSFARAVFADRLPPEILHERKRGAQGGAWFRRLDTRRQDIAEEVEHLEASPLARRLLDVPRLKRLVREWPADERAALERTSDYLLVLSRALHFSRFIRWAENGNA